MLKKFRMLQSFYAHFFFVKFLTCFKLYGIHNDISKAWFNKKKKCKPNNTNYQKVLLHKLNLHENHSPSPPLMLSKCSINLG